MERKLHDQSVEDMQELINAIIDHLPLGVYVKDGEHDFNYLYWNKFMEDITGIDTVNIEGKNDTKVSYDALISAEKRMELERRIIHTGEIAEIHGKAKNPAGETKDIEMTKYPLTLKDGRSLLLVLWRDITARHAIEKAMKRTQTLANMALNTVNIQTCSIYINPDSKVGYMDSTVERFNRNGQNTENTCHSLHTIFKQIHPEDIELYKETFISLCKGETNECKIEVRDNANNNKEYRWKEVTAYVYEHDETNRPSVILSCAIDIQERKEQELNLEDARLKAEKADKLKSKYLANMNHEIRTPLNAITGFSELMAYADTEEERKEYYEIIKANNILLMQLVNDILDLSKIEADVTKITYVPIDLNDLMMNIYASVRLRMPEGVELILKNSEERCTFITDHIRLMQLINNLLNNAIKNTRQGSIIYGYSREGNRMKFYVQDTGTGIAKDKLPSIFDRYVKVNDYAEGIGLGLAICHGLVTKMEGEIQVDSELGKGSVFTFTLPVRENIESD